jgi:hypothetical protein
MCIYHGNVCRKQMHVRCDSHTHVAGFDDNSVRTWRGGANSELISCKFS